MYAPKNAKTDFGTFLRTIHKVPPHKREDALNHDVNLFMVQHGHPGCLLGIIMYDVSCQTRPGWPFLAVQVCDGQVGNRPEILISAYLAR